MTIGIAEDHRQSGDFAAWSLLAGLGCAIILLQMWSPLGLDLAGLASLALACTGLTAAALFYVFVRPRAQFATMCLSLMQVLLFTSLGALLSYLVAREGGVLWDETFSRWDRAIGFDWLAYVRLIDSSAVAVTTLRIAYGSLIPQMIAVVLILGFSERTDALRATMLAAMVSGTITVLLSPLFPAVSNFVYLGVSAADFRHVNPSAGFIHMAHFNALRDGSLTAIGMSDMQGIITFPSYHAALAAVTCWGFWQSKVAAVRWAGCGIAVLTIVATPVDGGHYLVDLIAGIAVAVASMALANRAIYWRFPVPVTASPFRRSRGAFAR